MEKFYVTKLEDEQLGQGAQVTRTRLIDVQFARQPPTFGALHLMQRTANEHDDGKTQQWLQLATLTISNDQSAKFQVAQELNLGNQCAIQVVDFATLNNQLLLEVPAHMSSSLERLRSSCFALTQAGDLFIIPLIDQKQQHPSIKPIEGPGIEHKFVALELDPRPDEQLTAKNQFCLRVHMLSETCYRHYQLLFTGAQLDYSLQLLSEYSLRSTGRLNQSLRFSQLVLIGGTDVVMLKLSDTSRHFVRAGKCLYSQSEPSACGQTLALTSTSSSQTPMLLDYSGHKLVASSLLVRERREDEAGNNDEHEDGDELDTDPDKLLPRTPSFELEECWSIDLTEIEGLRPRLLDVEETSELKGCLCPLEWETIGSGNSQKNSKLMGQSFGWPRFLLLACFGHVLLYDFEQADEQPFPLVYDRAFLELTGHGGEQNKSRPAAIGRRVDLQLRPRLVHNFKLVGATSSDAMMNLLFLVQDVRLNEMRNFAQLGLLAARTNANHILVLKLTSPAVLGPNKRDNLYQQSLLAALRNPALLNEEIRRVQTTNSWLREQLMSLSADQLLEMGKQPSLRKSEQLISAELRRAELLGGLYTLDLQWPSLLVVRRVLVLSTVSNSRMLASLEHENHLKVKSVEIDNCADSGSLARRTLFLRLKPKAGTKQESANQVELRHLESTVKSWIRVELAPASQRNGPPMVGNPFARSSLKISVFMLDSQQLDGHLQATFVLDSPSTQPKNSRLKVNQTIDVRNLVDQSHFDDVRAQGSQVDLPSKYHRQMIPIRPLHSYYSSSLPSDLTQMLLLELEGSFSGEQMLAWLDECLSIDGAKLQQRMKEANQQHPVQLAFGSNFTHCSIVIHLRVDFGLELRQLQSWISISSDDFMALAFLERHLFKRATDSSIKLTRSTKTRPLLVVSGNNLRHLIERQWLNVELYHSLIRKNSLAGRSDDSKRRREHIDLLIETLMGETLDLQALPIRTELKQSTSWLEHSLRQDLDHLVSTQQEELMECDDRRKARSKLATFVDMICGFIIDALVDHQHLHETAAQVSQNMMLEMRTKLIGLLRQPDINESKFVAQLLNDWNETLAGRVREI